MPKKISNRREKQINEINKSGSGEFNTTTKTNFRTPYQQQEQNHIKQIVAVCQELLLGNFL